VKPRVKRRANTAYRWMEGNPATAILVCSGLSAMLTVAAITALGLYSTSTFEGKTACGRDASGPECAKLRQEVARAEPITNPCISYQRVTSEKGRNCPKQFVYRRHRAHPTATQPRFQRGPSGPDGGRAGNGDDAGALSPSKSGGGKAEGPGDPDSGSPSGSQKGSSDAPSSPSPTVSNPAPSATPGGSTATNPSPTLTPPQSSNAQGATPVLPATVDAVGKAGGEVVEKAGGAVNDTLDNARCTLTPNC
jgi:hypothetical protein